MRHTLDKMCFKIDKCNAMAMINGVTVNNRKLFQAIWCSVKDNPFPMLITLNRSKSKYKMSELGNSMKSDNFIMPLKYIAIAEKTYFIKNDIELWRKLCTNGLFNTWVPESPYARFDKAKADPSKHRISLIRVYEIEKGYTSKDIVHASSHIDHLMSDNKDVTVKKAIVDDRHFSAIKSMLENTVKQYLK